MSTKARARNRRKRRDQRLPLFGILVGAVVAIGVLAVLLVAVGGGSGGDKKDSRPQQRPVTIRGTALAPFQGAGLPDPAVGASAPTLKGKNFDGNRVAIRANGRPEAVVFLAHWCPHCQAEVPRLADYLESTGLPEGVDLYIVSTGTSPDSPNYPPSAWLEREGLAGLPTLVDDEGSPAGKAFGLASYPFAVFLNADHKVAGRVTGENIDFEAILAALARGEPLPAGTTGPASNAG